MAALVTGMFVSFYMMPFLVHTLGDRWYGFWALAGSIVGYYTVLDLGLTNAAHRFLAIASARKDNAETTVVFSTALILFVAGAAVVLCLTGLTWVVAPWFVPAPDLATARMLVLLLGASFAIGFPVAVFNGVLAATLRYDLSSYIHIGKLLFRTVLMVVALRQTPSVVMLGWITLGTEVGGTAATGIAAFRLWPWLTVSLGAFDRDRAREFFSYGLYAFLVRIGDIVRFGVDGVVIAVFVGVSAVTHYSIASRLTDYFRDLIANALGVLMPMFSRYHGLNDTQALFERVRQTSRLSVALCASIAGGAIIFGAPFIRRWMGPQYLDAYWPLVILTIAVLLGAMQGASTNYLFAIAKHRYFAVLNGADAVANLILSLLLVPRFGILGVALGTVIPALVFKLYLQPRYVCAHLGFPLRRYWMELGGTLAGTIALQAPIGVVVWFVQPQTYVGLLGLGVGLYGVYAVALYMFVLRPEDQDALAAAVPPLASLLTMRRLAVSAVRGSD